MDIRISENEYLKICNHIEINAVESVNEHSEYADIIKIKCIQCNKKYELTSLIN